MSWNEAELIVNLDGSKSAFWECPHCAGTIHDVEPGPMTEPQAVTTVAELDALPVGSIIWYSLYHDGDTIYSIMRKERDGSWMNPTDPDDAYEYAPLLPATVLPTGVQA